MDDTFNANKQTNMPITENLKTVSIFSYNFIWKYSFHSFPVNFVDTVLGIVLQMLICQNFKIGVYILPWQIVAWLSRMSWLKVPSSMRQSNHHSQLGDVSDECTSRLEWEGEGGVRLIQGTRVAGVISYYHVVPHNPLHPMPSFFGQHFKLIV